MFKNLIFPLWSLTILLTIDSPNPVPFFLVVKYGLRISLMFFSKTPKPIPLSFIIKRIWSSKSFNSIEIFLSKSGLFSAFWWILSIEFLIKLKKNQSPLENEKIGAKFFDYTKSNLFFSVAFFEQNIYQIKSNSSLYFLLSLPLICKDFGQNQ